MPVWDPFKKLDCEGRVCIALWCRDWEGDWREEVMVEEEGSDL